MDLADKLHCPRCKGRLEGSLESEFRCTDCEHVVPVLDGIADFIGSRAVTDSDPNGFAGYLRGADAADPWAPIRIAAGGRWPVNLGDVLELGCGGGHMTRGLAPALNAEVRGLIVTDTAMEMVRRARDRLGQYDPAPNGAMLFARLSFLEDAIRDAVADTVVGSAVLPRFGDIRACFAMVHRVLRAGGRALFLVPNRRYHQAFCQAAATALARLYARDGLWPEGSRPVLQMLAGSRQQLIHQGDLPFLSALREKHLFDSDALEDLAREVGFATAEAIPLHPDPLAGETARQLFLEAAIPDGFATQLAPLVAFAGAPFFSLLSSQDASASTLLWLTKGIGARPRTFSARPSGPAVGLASADAALGGAPPRWSIELVARDTADGVVLSVGGWCLVNTDVAWVRLKLDGVGREAPVWRARPDVHEVLNTHGHYHPLNALCCGMAAELLFDGVHPRDDQCQLQFEIVLTNGLIVQGPAPHVLATDQKLIIAQ